MIIIALGSNRGGRWGDPAATLKRAAEVIERTPGTVVLCQSAVYETAGVGPGRPDNFVNSVIAIESHCGPEALLRRLKAIERMAGPRSALRWGPRTLDLDILDYRGRIVNWFAGDFARGASRPRLILPHPLLHLRPFVLEPLNEILPNWRHPVLQRSAKQLWREMRKKRTGRVLRRL